MTSVALKVGQGIDLDARVFPTTAETQNVIWSSKNPKVAVVDSHQGIVTAVGPGQTYIVALACDGSGVTASVPVKVSPNDLGVLTQDVPADLPATFGFKLSQDSKITVVNAEGRATTTSFSKGGNLLQEGAIAVYPSTAKINKNVVDMTGQSGSLEDFQSQYAIMVATAGSSLQPMISVLKVLNNRKTPVSVMTSTSFANTRASEPVVYYQSLNLKKGWQTGTKPAVLCTIQPGKSAYVAAPVGTNINVETEDGEVVLTIPTCKAGAEYPLTIEENNIPVEKITINNNESSVVKGQTLQLSATVAPEDATNKVLNWSSSDEKVATVDKNGKVTALAVGKVTITATSDENPEIKASATVTVKPISVVEIKLSNLPESVMIGDTFTIKATVLPTDADNKKVIWQSSDKNVATVDQNGKVTALALGEVTITVTSDDDPQILTTTNFTVKPKNSTEQLGEGVNIFN